MNDVCFEERIRKDEGTFKISDFVALIGKHLSPTSLCPPSPQSFSLLCVADLRKQVESSELRNQRLKEVFQRKILEFRTVCYVLTGYQIDLTAENQYRLTSVYAEHMEDSLIFKKVGDDASITHQPSHLQLQEKLPSKWPKCKKTYTAMLS